MRAPTDRTTRKWAEIRFRYLAAVRKGRLPFSSDETNLQADSAPYLTMEYLRGENSEPTFVSVGPGLLMASAGAVLLLWDGSNAGEFLRAKRGIVSSTSALVTPKFVDPMFFFWACKGQEDRVKAETVGMGIPHVNGEFLANLRIPLPNQFQQRTIANYLDHETARLDALVAAKERVLALLTERRMAFTTHAVTRGLDPRVSLRDSGIPWLGEIPAKWNTRRAAWLFRERDERGEPDLPLLEVSINSGVVLREFSEERIESTAADFNTYKIARQGDVVFNKMRMWQGAVGVTPVDGLVSPDYVVAEPTGPLSPQYAALLFRTDKFAAECARRSHGIVWDRLRLYWEGFRDIILPLPPPDVQKEVAAHIGEATAKLDAMSFTTKRTIELLKERRATLIVAAVTGQIDVEGTV